MSRSFISLGDALRALADLEPQDEDTREAIIDMLGLKSEHFTLAPRSIGAWKPSSKESVMTAQQNRMFRHGRYNAPVREPERRAAPRSHRPSVRSTVRKVRSGTGVFEPPAWVREPGESLEPARESGPSPKTIPLFGRLWRRGILSAALETTVPEGDLDLDQILDIVGDGRPLEWLPRLPISTTRRGVQVLVDRGPGMDPFVEDQLNIEQALDAILADDRLEVLFFTGCPSRGVGKLSRDTWRNWKPPPPGTPVLSMTDLGIGGPLLDQDRATSDEWLGFAHRVRAEGHTLLALVPYEAHRWPTQVARAMTLLHWSERTTVGEVRRAMRDAWYRRR